MMKDELRKHIRKIIKEETGVTLQSEINKADNAVWSAMVKLRQIIDKISPEAKADFKKIQDEFNDSMSAFYKKH